MKLVVTGKSISSQARENALSKAAQRSRRQRARLVDSPRRPLFKSSMLLCTLSADLSRKINEMQTAECTNRQISSNCERFTLLIGILFLAENGPFEVALLEAPTTKRAQAIGGVLSNCSGGARAVGREDCRARTQLRLVRQPRDLRKSHADWTESSRASGFSGNVGTLKAESRKSCFLTTM